MLLCGLAQSNIHPDLETWPDERIMYMARSMDRLAKMGAKAAEESHGELAPPGKEDPVARGSGGFKTTHLPGAYDPTKDLLKGGIRGFAVEDVVLGGKGNGS